MDFCKDLKGRQPDYSKVEGNLIILKFFKILHFIISSNILLLKFRADLYTDCCLFVCYPPSIEIVHIQERGFIIILIGFWYFHVFVWKAKAIKLEAHKESVTVFSCHDALIFLHQLYFKSQPPGILTYESKLYFGEVSLPSCVFLNTIWLFFKTKQT